MKQQRLLLLTSDAAADIRQFHCALEALCDRTLLRSLTIKHMDGPHVVGGTRRNMFCAWGPPGLDLSELSGQLESLVKAYPSGAGEEVLALFADPAKERARAYLKPSAGFARSLEGELFHVVREAAGWVELEPVQMMRSGLQSEATGAQRQLMQMAGIHLGAAAEPEPLPEPPDADDRFVEQKLAEAGALMARYRAAKKPD